jgi:predicted component of type VI protein secretion system
MSVIYLIGSLGELSGPYELPTIPGLGVQLPANGLRLDEPLPTPSPGYAWALANGAPQQLECHLGNVYEKASGAATEWLQLGPLPEHLTDAPRPSAEHRWIDGAWRLDPKAMHASKVQDINHACEAAITAGFQSSALGAPHQYSSQLDDQLNLTGAILRGLDMPYACRDEQGAKAFRLHTAAQLRQVGDDFTLYKLQLLQRANELKQQLDLALAAGDAEAMQAITWEGAES